ncbi:hypothetical protein ACHHYP_08309 [Achlya hypogyna]|uniref:Protein kinase domain-containing protein n=1 Tax=Achlya hypogyna TaxID=1202772 RepID=A0A1V9ZKU0_ACHHY|nr:hypothetical protein ACHHYP_08309 [Achlya hypogyna]
MLAENKAAELQRKQMVPRMLVGRGERYGAPPRCKSAASARTPTNQGDNELEDTAERRTVPLVEMQRALDDIAVLAEAPAEAASRLDKYALGHVVGTGTFGLVRVATHRATRQLVAIKSYERSRAKDSAQWKRLQGEARVMERLDHPCIIRLFEAIEEPAALHLVMEHVAGDVANLCEHVKRQRRLREKDAGALFGQVLAAVVYMHGLHVVHRDIKLENILLDTRGGVKLVDFGFSALQTARPFQTFCGTPCYMAPEIIHRKTYWGPPVDVWSLGVLLYAMLCGFFPFRARNYSDLYRKIVKGAFDIPASLSADAHDLLRSMLAADPVMRLTVFDVRAHPWTRRFAASRPRQPLPLYRQLSLGTLPPATIDELRRLMLVAMGAFGVAPATVTASLQEKRHDGISTLYFLLLKRAEATCRGRRGVRDDPLPRAVVVDDCNALAAASVRLGSPGNGLASSFASLPRDDLELLEPEEDGVSNGDMRDVLRILERGR